ncbi:UDP-N-acetylmuramoyl-L-alanyl-D-glutamate--2,6-diaminopimelate ligase [bacterium]|nr:UDP-N-acetylmuramoyl-L-alanyl-D-glutamate--2,6-diaminopimelate ligase [bacterium]
MEPAAAPPSTSVSLRALFPTASWFQGNDLVVTAATDRAADCTPSGLFAVIRGVHDDGRRYLDQAVSLGISGLLVEQPHPSIPLPQCLVLNVRRAYARLCAELAGQPTQAVATVGVTGTNGKTTTTWMLQCILRAAGHRCGLLGTIHYHDGNITIPAKLTTPDSRTLQQWLQRMRQNGTGYAAIELSSHALHQDRAAGVELAAAIVTNITHDHLDYHGSFERYVAAKQKIWSLLRPGGTAIVNLDDAGGRSLLAGLPEGVTTLTTSLEQTADITASNLQLRLSGTRFELQTPHGTTTIELTTPGRHNVANALGAVAAAMSLGVSLEAIAAGLAEFRGAPGRMESMDFGQPFAVLVDYAHTDDALTRALQTLRPLTPGRLICVFGAGGDRDRSKRPKLGQAALSADVAIVTSDNPRSEDPQRIIDDVLAGMSGKSCEILVEPDRYQAIQLAVDMAEDGDCILLAGKGHEPEQIIGSQRLPFDDREVARQCLANRLQLSSAPSTTDLSPLRMRA